ncbi:hypothetical protein MGYG_02977 [Nannizzia gypsea CBS 118893]|uniref:Uncharacterized protein n=1 Tax=Arthroderma gypseum (strain ATCC MYA-4604 / CBS 118893) TaxID=535722 RepID=E4UQ50_ARTGP|nr:hypothetical protein MGYG_02977 [Nannizzia gypsea CBS 118893]EFQ99969.1 hypothetical protein MGYG_02977 [Nannizzia gypsea CBS 118893]
MDQRKRSISREQPQGREAGLASCVQEYALTSAMMLQGPLTRIAANPPLCFFPQGKQRKSERRRKKQKGRRRRRDPQWPSFNPDQHGQIMPALGAGEGASPKMHELRARSFVEGQACEGKMQAQSQRAGRRASNIALAFGLVDSPAGAFRGKYCKLTNSLTNQTCRLRV